MSTQFIVHDFKLPNHSNELSKAEEIIEKIKNNVRSIETNSSITDEIHLKTYEEVCRILDYVGNLSKPIFEIETEIEDLYVLKFPHSPELARKLWQEHYEELHHPYNILKNRCFRLLDDLDEEFHRVHKKHPSNWNI
jgi:hypothetical protein